MTLALPNITVRALWRIPAAELATLGTSADSAPAAPDGQRIFTIAAALAEQHLETELLDRLEAAGWVVIEVPATLKDASLETITEHVLSDLEVILGQTAPASFPFDEDGITRVNAPEGAPDVRQPSLLDGAAASLEGEKAR